MKLPIPPEDVLRRSLADKSVLIVADKSVVLKIVSQICGQMGFGSVATAHNGEEALAALAARPCSLLMPSMYMEPMSGLELLVRVRAVESLATVPIMMMTVQLEMEAIFALHRAGVDSCIIMPFTTMTFREKLGTLLR